MNFMSYKISLLSKPESLKLKLSIEVYLFLAVHFDILLHKVDLSQFDQLDGNVKGEWNHDLELFSELASSMASMYLHYSQ